MVPGIIVHGGARRNADLEDERVADVRAACEAGYKVLLTGAALDAVETAIARMESSPILNAGEGSFLQLDGRVRMDASIMGSDMNAGGVIGIEDVEHPIAVARRVMENTQHVILSGKLATEFAYSEGFPRFDPRTREKVEGWLDIMEQFKKKTSYEQVFHIDQYLKEGRHNLGTVGCVAIDAAGRIAAGTSTGGRRMNVPGRVGDSGIVGAGTYCCPHGGVSCTGVGEKIMVLSLAKEVANFLRFNRGSTAQAAVDHGVAELSSIGGEGGLICIDSRGNIGYGFNTRGMTMHCIGSE